MASRRPNSYEALPDVDAWQDLPAAATQVRNPEIGCSSRPLIVGADGNTASGSTVRSGVATVLRTWEDAPVRTRETRTSMSVEASAWEEKDDNVHGTSRIVLPDMDAGELDALCLKAVKLDLGAKDPKK